jgi:hypothetical protein
MGLKNLFTKNSPYPTFFIIGAQKSGTTTLFENLMKHTKMVRASKKELNYFSWGFEKGDEWYKNQFREVINTTDKITGDATTNYIWHPLAARRIKNQFPQTKIIIILRNPIDRAYSHFNMSVQENREWLSFEDAINEEEKRLYMKEEGIINGSIIDSFDYKFHSYLSRGKYIYQIQEWMQHFDKKQFLILKTEDLMSDSNSLYSKVFEFLEIPEERIEIQNFRVGNYSKMKSETRIKLIEFFKPHNEKLAKFLNMDFNWDK